MNSQELLTVISGFKSVADYNELELVDECIEAVQAHKERFVDHDTDLTACIETLLEHARYVRDQYADIEKERDDLDSANSELNGEVDKLRSELEELKK